MEIVFASVLLLLLTRITTVFYLNKKNSFYTDGDAIGHLNYIKAIYKDNGRIPEKLEKYLLDYNDYPNGFHRLFYLLGIPIRFLERFGGYFPTLFDLGLLLFTALFIKVSGGDHYYWLLAFPFLRLLISNEGRSSHFSERAYGVFWGNVFLGSMIGFYLYGDLVWLFFTVASFFVFSVSSKFAWQATFFITLLLSAFEQTWFFVAVYFLCFSAASLFSRGYSYKVLKGTIRHSFFYKTYLSQRYFGLPNHYHKFFSAFGRTGIRHKIMLVMTNSVFKLFSDNPLNLAILFLILSGAEWSVFYSWAMTGMVLLLLISLETFKFLGEPERYLEFSFIPVFVILSLADIPYFIVAMVVIGVFSIYLLHLYLFISAYRQKQNATPDMIDIIGFFEETYDKTLLTIPLRLSFLMGYFSDTNRFVTYFSNIAPGKLGKEYRELIPDLYPYPGRNLDRYIKKYDIDYIVLDKGRINLLNDHHKETYYSFDAYELIYENDSYIVYKVQRDE